jgi:hypothetical protein
LAAVISSPVVRKEALAAVGVRRSGSSAILMAEAYHKFAGYGRKNGQTIEIAVYFRIRKCGRKFNRLRCNRK